MKPKKNRFFCEDCGKVKMLFETKKKADTFIAFNREEIAGEKGYKPERSYFCPYCGGWHVTSHKEQLSIQSRTERVIDLYNRENEKKAVSKIKKQIQTRGETQDIVYQAHRKELEALAKPLREQAALEQAQAIEQKKKQQEQEALERAKLIEQKKKQQKQEALERAKLIEQKKKQQEQEAFEKAQAIEQKKKQNEQAALERAQLIEQKKKQKEQAALERAQAIEQQEKQREQMARIRAKKIDELRPILHYADYYIGMLERLSLRSYNPNIVKLLDRVTDDLEKAKSIGVSYNKSNKRIARIKERADILRNKYKK